MTAFAVSPWFEKLEQPAIAEAPLKIKCGLCGCWSHEARTSVAKARYGQHLVACRRAHGLLA